jgi:hypothetical protein
VFTFLFMAILVISMLVTAHFVGPEFTLADVLFERFRFRARAGCRPASPIEHAPVVVSRSSCRCGSAAWIFPSSSSAGPVRVAPSGAGGSSVRHHHRGGEVGGFVAQVLTESHVVIVELDDDVVHRHRRRLTMVIQARREPCAGRRIERAGTCSSR